MRRAGACRAPPSSSRARAPMRRGGPRVLVTDASGEASLDVPPGDYRLLVELPGFEPATVEALVRSVRDGRGRGDPVHRRVCRAGGRACAARDVRPADGRWAGRDPEPEGDRPTARRPRRTGRRHRGAGRRGRGDSRQRLRGRRPAAEEPDPGGAHPSRSVQHRQHGRGAGARGDHHAARRHELDARGDRGLPRPVDSTPVRRSRRPSRRAGPVASAGASAARS